MRTTFATTFALTLTLLCLGVSIPAVLAQPQIPTTLPLSTIRPSLITGVVVCVASKPCRVAMLDPATLALDEGGPLLVLRAILPAPVPPATITERNVVVTPTAGAIITVPDPYAPGSLMVYRNGLLLSVPNDYTVDTITRVLTFVSLQSPQDGDIYVLHYRF